MVPNKFNVVDFGGFDLAGQYGEALPGIYDKIVYAHWNCVYIMCFGLKFGGLEIAPQYMIPEMFSDHIMLNGIISIDQNDVITVPSIEPPPVEPVILPGIFEENGTFNAPSGLDGFNPVTVQVPPPVISALVASENGTYNPPSGVDGYAPVTVNVSVDEGPIYYGTSAPLSSLGNNEDLYIQYKILESPFDHTYDIVGEFRKVGGVWVPYEPPALSTPGVHVWTKSTGGLDAAMYVQNGYWDVDNNMFVATGEVESVLYTTVGRWDIAKNCNGIALLAYPNGWQVKATTTITDGTNIYQTDAIAKQWTYTTTVDFYIWKSPS